MYALLGCATWQDAEDRGCSKRHLADIGKIISMQHACILLRIAASLGFGGSSRKWAGALF